MRLVIALALLFAAAPSRAADANPAAPDATTIKLVDYFLRTPLSDANPDLVTPFLAVDAATLPERLRGRTQSKQIEIRTLLKLHDTRKKGNWLTPSSCPISSYVKPLEDLKNYRHSRSCRKEDSDGSFWCEISEDEEQVIQQRTQCTLSDQGCEFTLVVFVDMLHKKKPRRMILAAVDPLTVIAVAAGKSGQTHFFGTSLTCYHPK